MSVMTQTAWVIFFFFHSSGDKASRGPFLASRQLVQTPPMRFEFSHYPFTPSHHLHAGSAAPGWTARPNEGRRIQRTSSAEPCRGSFCRPPLFNQFTGREPKKRRDDYCRGAASVLAGGLSNPANTSSTGCQIEQ